MNVSRRATIRNSIGLAMSGVLGARLSPLGAAPQDAAKLLAEFTADVTPVAGSITFTAPELAENGNIVPVAVSVDSPMTDDDYVEAVMIVAEENPNPEVITFHFTPQSGIAYASTRMRLAKTQKVIAVAKTSNGSVFIDTRHIEVVIGGCGA